MVLIVVFNCILLHAMVFICTIKQQMRVVTIVMISHSKSLAPQKKLNTDLPVMSAVQLLKIRQHVSVC
jgi:hypothetical protein